MKMCGLQQDFVTLKNLPRSLSKHARSKNNLQTRIALKTFGSAVIGVGAGNFLGVQRIFCQDFPKFVRKTFLYKLSPYKFSVAVGTLHFPQPCCHTYFTFQMAD